MVIWLYDQYMGRPTNTATRRCQIVQGLARAMAAHGYAGATVNAIAKAAGLAPGLIHYHFPDKHAILLELCTEVSDLIARRYRTRTAAESSAQEKLAAFIDAHVALGADADAEAVAAWSAIAAEAPRDQSVGKVYRRHLTGELAELGRLFTAALQSQGRRVADVEEKSALVLAAIEGAFRIAAAAPGATPRGFAARGIRRLAEALIAGEPLLPAGS